MWRSVVVNYLIWGVEGTQIRNNDQTSKHMKDDLEQLKGNFQFIEKTQQSYVFMVTI